MSFLLFLFPCIAFIDSVLEITKMDFICSVSIIHVSNRVKG